MKPKAKNGAVELDRVQRAFVEALTTASQEDGIYWWDCLEPYLFLDRAIRAQFMAPLGAWVLDQLTSCKDKLPDELCRRWDLKPGSTVAMVVKVIREEWMPGEGV